jgi:hypothetical protein
MGSTKFVSILKMSLPLAEKPCTVCWVAVTIISFVGSAFSKKKKICDYATKGFYMYKCLSNNVLLIDTCIICMCKKTNIDLPLLLTRIVTQLTGDLRSTLKSTKGSPFLMDMSCNIPL